MNTAVKIRTAVAILTVVGLASLGMLALGVFG
jgi:hypothetical protein